jgi:hypothetical protein
MSREQSKTSYLRGIFTLLFVTCSLHFEIKEFSMKKNLKIFGIIVLLAVIGLSMTGCPEDSFTHKYTNNSSHDLTVTCKDLNPSSFSLNKGETKTATSSLAVVIVTWTPHGLVVIEDSGSGKYTFKDKGTNEQ